jgi:hypothetical protein
MSFISNSLPITDLAACPNGAQLSGIDKDGIYESMAMKGDLVVAVGSNAPPGSDAQAVVLWGRR